MEIVHIPEKPPIQPNQQPIVDVLATSIEPKLANTLVRRLNQIAPLESLRHVKRVCKNNHLRPHFRLGGGGGEGGEEEGAGKTGLSVILCLASQNANDSYSVPHDVQELITSYHLTTFKTKVCRYAATSKEEWEEQCKLWPTSFHPPTYNIDGITGFSNEDAQSIFSFMSVAIQLAKSGGGSVVNAAVIVDPSNKQVISSARDQTCSWDTPQDTNTTETSCCEQREAFNSDTDCKGRSRSKTLRCNCLPDETKELYSGVSCLFPWGWAEQQPNASSRHWHPLWHAAMVAIESSAARDRQLFPSLGEIQDESTDMGNMQSTFVGSPAKRQKTNSGKVTSFLCALNEKPASLELPRVHIHSEQIQMVIDDHLSPSSANYFLILCLNCLGVTCTIGNNMSDLKLLTKHANQVKGEEILDNSMENSHSMIARPYLCTGYDIYLVWEPCPMCAMALVHQRIRRIFFAFPNANAGAVGSVYRLQGERSLNHHYAVFRVMVPEPETHCSPQPTDNNLPAHATSL